MVPERETLLWEVWETLLTSFINGAFQKECAEIEFPFHAQAHDSILKNIAVFANKTLLEILLVGLHLFFYFFN